MNVKNSYNLCRHPNGLETKNVFLVRFLLNYALSSIFFPYISVGLWLSKLSLCYPEAETNKLALYLLFFLISHVELANM